MRRTVNLWLLLGLVLCGVSLLVGGSIFSGNEPGSGTPEVEVRKDRGREEIAPPLEEPIHLVILNGTSRGGLARDFGHLVSALGCVADRVGNAPRQDYPASFLVNRRLQGSRLAWLKDQLGPVRVLREWDDRTTEDAVLIVGADADRLRDRLEEAGYALHR